MDTELLGHLGDIVGAVGHESRCHGQFFALELAWPSTALASRPCRFQPCHGSFTNQVALKLGQRCKQVKHQLARGGVGVDLLGERFKPHAPRFEGVHRLHQVGQIAPKAV